MKGLYKGSFSIGGAYYSVQRTVSSTSERIDFLSLPTMDASGFYVMNPDNISIACSVYIRGGQTWYYGNYNLYNQYTNLINTLKYYYFRGDEVIKDSETTFNADGIRQVTHHRSSDNNLEFQQEMHQGNVVSLSYRCGTQELELTLAKENVTVKMLSKLEYTELVFDDYNTVQSVSTYRSLNEIATFKDLKWLEEKRKKYFVIQTVEEFDALVAQLEESMTKGYAIAFDTETTGVHFNRLGVMHPNNDELVGICITDKVGYGWYIPVNHLAINNIPLAYVLERMHKILTQGKLVTHYGKFDYSVMLSYGRCKSTNTWGAVDFENLSDYEPIRINIVQDTFLLLYLLSNIDSQQNLKLKNATVSYLGIDQIELSDIFPSGEGNQVAFQILPLELVWAYAPADADFTLSLYQLLKDKLPPLTRSLYGHEVLFMEVLANMEFFGNRVDMEQMRLEAQKCIQDINVLEQSIYKMAGYVFNINSSPALSKLFYEDLKCEVITKTPQGTPSTGSTALKNLAKKTLDKPVTTYTDICSPYTNNDGTPNVLVKAKTLNTAKYPIIHVIMKYKKLVKLHSTFFVGLERDNQDGWMFSSYNQTRAATGRTISNFQQIPGSLKHLIVPWGNEYYMVNLDYKSIELFVMAGVAGQQDIIEQFSNPEADAHRIIGSQILKKPPQEISGSERKDMKVANFGVPFDMGPASLAQFLFGFPVTRENKEYAAKLKADYLNAMPKVKRMFNDVRDKAQTKGIVTTKFGRCGVFRNLVKETDAGLIARGRRQAGNLIIQGTAADILKIATNRLFTTFRERSIDAHITGTIHDELILIVNKKHHPYEIIKMIKECMELKIKDFPPIFTGISVSNDWGEGHGREILEMPQYLAQEICAKVDRGQLDYFEGNPRDFILSEIRDYLHMRFNNYFDELGYRANDIENNDFYHLVNEFKHMYLGPRCVAYYTDFGGNEGEPDLKEAVKLALRDYSGLSLDRINELYKRDTPADKSSDLEEVVFNFDLSDLVSDTYYDFEEEEDVIEDVEDADTDVINVEQYRQSSIDTTRIIVTYDSVIINLDGCTTSTVTALTEYFKENHADNGFMNVVYNYHNTIIDTKFRVDNVDRDYLMQVIEATRNSLAIK